MNTWNERMQELFFFTGIFALAFTALAGNGDPQEVVVQPARILHIKEHIDEPTPIVPISQWQLFAPTGTGLGTGPGTGAGTLAVVS